MFTMFILAMQYNENEDTTSLSYKRFTETFDNTYPALSLCFEGDALHWYNDLHLFNEFGTTPNEFGKMLKGQYAYMYVYNVTSTMYGKIPVLMSNRSHIDIDHFRLRLSDILVKAKFITENPMFDYRYDNIPDSTSEKNLAFVASYQTAGKICFTRKTNHTINTIRTEDWLGFNRSFMAHGIYNSTRMQVFLHYPGQLMTSMNSPGFDSVFAEYQWNKILEVKLSQGTLVNKRPDSKQKCKVLIGSHDVYLQDQVSKKADCVPPYWNESLGTKQGIGKCHTPSQLKQVHNSIENLGNMSISQVPPCLKWFTSFTYNWQTASDDDVSYIHIVYQDQYYAELLYSRAFGIVDLFSGVGGFAGLFIGFSLVQSPEIVGMYNFE